MPPTLNSVLVRPATVPEYRALVIAALVFVISLVICYMCIQLFHMRRGPRPTPRLSGAVDPFCSARAAPVGVDELGSFRYRPKLAQITCGAMPAIETGSYAACGGCDCPFGVPP